MRVALDGRTIGPTETGVGRAVRLLAAALGRNAPAGATLQVLAAHESARQLALEGLRVLPSSMRPTWHPLTEIWEATLLRLQLRRLGIEVYHAPAFRAPWLRGLGRVTTIHDLAAFTHPETVSRKFRIYLRASVRHALRRSDLVLCPSEAVRTELEQRFTRRKARLEAVAWGTPPLPRLSAEEASVRRTRLGLPGSYLLALGAGDRRKNHLRLLEAFALTRRSAAVPADLALVLCGAAAGHGPVAEERCIDRLGLTSYIQRSGYLDLRDMSAVYQGAIALAYPSLYEGFGFPILEAMSLGVPVLSSARGAMAEVAGDAAVLADPESTESLAEGLERLVSSQELRAELATRGPARAVLYDWDQTGQRHWTLYGELQGRAAAHERRR